MSEIYDQNHRKLQAEFETEKLADVVEQVIVHEEVMDEDKAFIESRDMFFLSTIDAEGRPTVSYKGGDPGFLKVVDEKTIAFPSYDGNGMFMSMGNISGNKSVGILFIDFENPHRLRLQGEASIDRNDPLMAEYDEADMIVRVNVSKIWKNCPRYIHKYTKESPSTFVPRTDCETPMPDWKRVDMLQPVLSPKDHGKAEKQGGTITIEELMKIEARDD
jgi:uncharacterized protein